MKCSTYPFCQCGAELVENLKGDARVTDIWLQYGLFSEPEVIVLTNGRKSQTVPLEDESCAYPTSK